MQVGACRVGEETSGLSAGSSYCGPSCSSWSLDSVLSPYFVGAAGPVGRAPIPEGHRPAMSSVRGERVWRMLGAAWLLPLPEVEPELVSRGGTGSLAGKNRRRGQVKCRA